MVTATRVDRAQGPAVKDHAGHHPAAGWKESQPAGDAAFESATRTPLHIQRMVDWTAPSEAVAGLVVDDADAAAPHQMPKTRFLDELETALRTELASSLKGSGFTADNCPWLDYYLTFYRAQDAAAVNAAAIRYGAAAASAEELIALVAARVRERVLRWRETGEVADPSDYGAAVPEGEASLGEVEEGAAVQRLGDTPAGVSGAQPQAIQRRLSSGVPLSGATRVRMENAFGTGFGQVRLHTNTEAGGLARGLRAKAFTIGQDVAFAPGEFAPGTLEGDLILAHELAHTLQQRGAAPWPASAGAESPALEREANVLAASAVFGDESLAAGRQSGLALRRCGETVSQPVEDSLLTEILLLLGNPDGNADAVIAKIDELYDNAPSALYRLGYFKDLTNAARLARYSGGRKILERAIAAFKKGGVAERVHGDEVQKLLDRYSAVAATPSEDEQKAIDTLNNAINGEDAAQLAIYKQGPMPLILPVRLYEYGREEVGGVYYDPHMPSDPKKGGAAGKTDRSNLTGSFGGTKYQHFHSGFIKIGSLALSSAPNARSTLYHEFLHYSFQRDRQLGRVTDPDMKQLQADQAARAATRENDEHVEICTLQLVRDFDALSDAEVDQVLSYLADHMPGANQRFIDRGVKRVTDFVTPDAKKQKRLLKLIGGLSKSEKAALEPFRAAVAALSAKKKKGKK